MVGKSLGARWRRIHQIKHWHESRFRNEKTKIFKDLEHDVSVLVNAPASVASLVVSCHSPDLQHATRHFNSIARQGAAVGTDPLNPVLRSAKKSSLFVQCH